MSAVGKIIAGIALVAIAIVAAPFTGGLSLYLIPVGLSLVVQGVMQAISGNKGTNAEAGKVNVRISEPIRWLNAGIARQGGGVLFGEYDDSGNLWFVVVHSDSLLDQRITVYLDDMPVTLDGSGNVTTDDFCLNDKGETYAGSGTKVPYFQIWTTTYTASAPTPPGVAALLAAFPGKWTTDHKLVGTTYSVVKCKSIKFEDRYKVYKWRGPLGMGEPSVSIVGQWTQAYDPRDDTQTLGDPTTYKFTRNAALLWAWFRTHRYGRNKSVDSINWSRVGEQADVCDETVIGISATQPRYTCTVSIPEDMERSVGEQNILMSMDAQLVFDGDGKCWCRAGKYYEPTLTLSRNRDIIAMESLEAQNGESETQGVIVKYVEPDAKYIVQPAAPWYNPLYYIPSQSVQYLTVEVPTIDNHNQAMRVAKTMGMRSQPSHKLAPTTGLRGLMARQERVINLVYDNTFAGDYEIYTPVEVNDSGVLCQFGLVPIDPDRFDLLLGEEKVKPVFTDAEVTTIPTTPASVTVAINNNRIEATFVPLGRDDLYYDFQYIKTADISSDLWVDMAVQMENLQAYSGPVAQGIAYSVRWRSITTAGRPSAWSTPAGITVGFTLDAASLLSVSIDSMTGVSTVQWRNPVSPNFAYLEVYRGTTTTFSAATKIAGPIIGGLGQVQSITDAPGTATYYYYWIKVYTSDSLTNGLSGPVGVLVATNSLAPSNNFTAWSVNSGGTGSTVPAMTANYGTAPDGSTTSTRVTFARGGATISFSRMRKDSTVSTPTNYKFGVWLKAASAGYSVALQLDTVNSGALNLTTSWAYYSFMMTSTSTTMSAYLTIQNSITNSPTTADVQVWGVHLTPVNS